jgi:transposase
VTKEALVRGDKPTQTFMFSYLSPEERVPADHPLRRVKKLADEALRGLSTEFDTMYSRIGRPSIPPESLLKAQMLMALYTVRSDRLFCEMLDYNILFRWFLDLDMESPSFDASTFSKNRERLIGNEVGARFLAQVCNIAKSWGLLSDEHFTVDGTLVEAWASLKSFKRVDGPDKGSDDDPSNPTVDFHGEQRSNQTHQSSSDPQSRLARKGKGKEAKLSYSANALMENRQGLCVGFELQQADGWAERDAALELLQAHREAGCESMKTVGADKGYHTSDFVAQLRAEGLTPHIATIDGRRTPGLDGRTTRHATYRLSQRIRKRIEEFFGWAKLIGGLRKTRYRGTKRVREHGFIVAVAYDLIRMAGIMPRLYFQQA